MADHARLPCWLERRTIDKGSQMVKSILSSYSTAQGSGVQDRLGLRIHDVAEVLERDAHLLEDS